MSNSTTKEAEQAGILVFGRFTAMGAGALVPFVIVRLLGKAEVGAFSALLLTYETLLMVTTAGLPGCVLYYLSNRTPEQRKALAARLFGAAQYIGFLLAGVLFFLGAYGNDIMASLGRLLDIEMASQRSDLSYLKLFALYPPLDATQRAFMPYCVATGRARAAATFGVLRALAVACGTLLPSALGLGVDGIVWGLVCFGLVQCAGIYYFFHKWERDIAPEEAEVSAAEMVRFSIPLGLNEIVGTLNAAVDRYTILFAFPSTKFAEYRSGAWQIPVKAIPYQVSKTYMPRYVKEIQLGRGEVAIEIWRRAAIKVSLIVVPICCAFLVCSEEFVRLALTDAYAAAAPVFWWYTVFTLGRITAFGPLIVASGRSDYVFRASFIGFVANIALTIPLTYYLGFVGPAVGTTMAFFPSVLAYCYYISKSLQVPIHNTFPLIDWLKVLILGGLSSLPALVIRLQFQPSALIAVVVSFAVTVPLFVALTRATGMMSKEDLAFALKWATLRFESEEKKSAAT